MADDVNLPAVTVKASKEDNTPPTQPVGYSYDPRSIDTARGQGYSDSEILDHVANELGVDIEDARNGGYSDSEILGHLTGATVKEPGEITRTTSPLQAAEIGAATAAGLKGSKEVAKLTKPAVRMAADIVKAAAGAPKSGSIEALRANTNFMNSPQSRDTLQRYLNGSINEAYHLPLEELERQHFEKTGKRLITPSQIQSAINQHLTSGDWDIEHLRVKPASEAVQEAKTIKQTVKDLPKTTAQMAAELKGAAPEFFKKTVPQAAGRFAKGAIEKAMPVLSTAATAADIQDITNRLRHGDYGRAAIGGLGLLGSAASYAPHPIAKGLGLAVGAGAPVVNEVIDRLYGREGYRAGGLANIKK